MQTNKSNAAITSYTSHSTKFRLYHHFKWWRRKKFINTFFHLLWSSERWLSCMATFFLLFLFIHLRLLIIYYTTTPSETVPIINSSRSLSASSNSNISNEGNNIIIITAKQPSKTYVYQIFEPNHPSHHQDQSTQNQFKRNQCNNALSVWQQVSTGYSRADSWTRGLSYIQHTIRRPTCQTCIYHFRIIHSLPTESL